MPTRTTRAATNTATSTELQSEREQAEDVLPPAPVLYTWPVLFSRLRRQAMKPGHLVQRKWLQKGKEQGYVSVPFTSAVKSLLPDSSVNICLIGRREKSDAVAKEWQKEIDDLPLFDVSAEVEAPGDLDPLEPPWETPLDERLPSDDEIRAMARAPGLAEHMQDIYNRDPEELAYRASKYREAAEAVIFRTIVEALPMDLRTEDYRALVRRTILEVIKLLWGMHLASDAVRLRWRLACTEGDTDGEGEESPVGLRAYFLLAGEGLDFVPSQYVDQDRIAATGLLSTEQIRRMSSEDWAKGVVSAGANISETLKRVPPGWTTYLKGDDWPGMRGKGAVFRLPKGKRLFVQVDFVKGPPKAAVSEEVEAASAGSEAGESEEAGKEVPKTLLWLGPLAGFAAGLFQLARNSPPYVFGQQRRREVDEVLRALQRVPETSPDAEMSISKFEQRLWMDFGDADEAPVVLVVGGQSETGRVISRKLVTSGYHVVLLKPGTPGTGPERVERMLPQGAVLASASVAQVMDQVQSKYIPDDLYDAVAGIDKLVICQCDEEGGQAERLRVDTVMNVLACWQMYRNEFAEMQRSYTTKVRLFNFARETDFELWDVERQRPSDLCYGQQRCGWTRNSYGKAHFIGQFFEPLGQAQLKSPKLKLNFKRFSGLLVRVYNQAVDNRYSWFLRTSDFEETRLQYEFGFDCEASSWHTVRMPFNAFKPVRADGVPLPEDELENLPLRREDVVQMGVVVRTEGQARPYGMGDALNYFSLALDSIKVFRTQAEPQVIYLGRQEDQGTKSSADEAGEAEEEEAEEELFFSDDSDLDEDLSRLRKAEAEAAAEIEELVAAQPLPEADDEDDTTMEFFERRPRSPMRAVIDSGLAYTIVKVTGLNDHPGGRYPVSVCQASVRVPPLSESYDALGSISRGDAAELVVSALTEPMCVNAEITAGETSRSGAAHAGESHTGSDLLTPTFEISSTMQEDVKAYLKQLTPNK